MKIPLSKTYEAHGEKFKELEFEEFRLGHLKEVRFTLSDDGLSFVGEDVLNMIAAMTNVPPSVIGQLGLADMKEAANHVVPLLKEFQAIGN